MVTAVRAQDGAGAQLDPCGDVIGPGSPGPDREQAGRRPTQLRSPGGAAGNPVDKAPRAHRPAVATVDEARDEPEVPSGFTKSDLMSAATR